MQKLMKIAGFALLSYAIINAVIGLTQMFADFFLSLLIRYRTRNN